MAISYTYTRQALTDCKQSLVKAFKDELRNRGKKASGSNIAAIKGESYVDYFNLGIKIFGSSTFKFIQDGRGAGKKQPPSGIIKSWLIQKKIKPHAVDGKKPTLDGLAFVIARSIGIKGIKPTDIIGKVLQKTKANIKSKLRYALRKDYDLKKQLQTK